MISTAVKRGVAPPEHAGRVAVDLMTTTNAAASEAMVAAGVRAATDVTGFGLLGHLHKLLLASGLRGRRSRPHAVPADPRRAGVWRAVGSCRAGPSATTTSSTTPPIGATCPEPEQLLLADAQTRGGMLIATPDPEALESRAARARRPCPSRGSGRLAEGIGRSCDRRPGRLSE